MMLKDPVLGLPFSAHSRGVEMPSAEDAAQKIRARIAAGTLPRDAPGMTFAGFGTHQACDGCDTPILPAEMEYEVPVRDGRAIRFHVRCVLLWEMYRRQRGKPEPPT
jgi:hypothetical protein